MTHDLNKVLQALAGCWCEEDNKKPKTLNWATTNTGIWTHCRRCHEDIDGGSIYHRNVARDRHSKTCHTEKTS